jgi:hypothetical protein
MINAYSIFRHFNNSVKRHMWQLILRQKKNFNNSKVRILSAVANHLVTRKTQDLAKKAEKNPSCLAFRWTQIGAQRCEIFMCSV